MFHVWNTEHVPSYVPNPVNSVDLAIQKTSIGLP